MHINIKEYKHYFLKNKLHKERICVMAIQQTSKTFFGQKNVVLELQSQY
jgi:hypothetical protein